MEGEQAAEWGATLDAYRLRLQDERMPAAERRALQDGANPAYIPRNALMQEAIAAAEAGSFDEVRRAAPQQGGLAVDGLRSPSNCARQQATMRWGGADRWEQVKFLSRCGLCSSARLICSNGGPRCGGWSAIARAKYVAGWQHHTVS